jgi:hypothetical protein
MTNPDLFWRGAWGVFRVHDAPQDGLWPLPGAAATQGEAVPHGHVRHYDVVALQTNVTYNERFGVRKETQLFALRDDADAILAGAKRPEPLVLRALPGEVVEVALENRLAEPVSLHASLLPALQGDPVGRNGDTTVAPGASRTYRWLADRAVGAVHLSSLGSDAPNATLRGLYGALVVEPDGARFDPATGPASVVKAKHGPPIREEVLLYASDDGEFESGVMPYTVDVDGVTSVNYRTEPLNARAGGQVTLPSGETIGGLGVHPCQFEPTTCIPPYMTFRPPAEARNPDDPLVLSSLVHGDPETPVIDVERGHPLVLRVVGGAGDQLQVHTVSGHAWNVDPGVATSNLVSAQLIGPGEVANVWIPHAGPGGAGDYLWGSHRDPFMEGGAWGILRVHGDDLEV